MSCKVHKFCLRTCQSVSLYIQMLDASFCQLLFYFCFCVDIKAQVDLIIKMYIFLEFDRRHKLQKYYCRLRNSWYIFSILAGVFSFLAVSCVCNAMCLVSMLDGDIDMCVMMSCYKRYISSLSCHMSVMLHNNCHMISYLEYGISQENCLGFPHI